MLKKEKLLTFFIHVTFLLHMYNPQLLKVMQYHPT